jgi:Zn-dependent M28 family amino/carboxypeptidase
MARTPASLLLPLILAGACLAPAEQVPSLPERGWGAQALGHMRVLSADIGSRVAGSPGEEAAARYIEGVFRELGYNPEIDRFDLGGRRGGVRSSANVIAVRQGRSPRELIVGAHYDSETRGPGADDNASGVGALLEIAGLAAGLEPVYTIRFVAFGAEEAGLEGSTRFVRGMDPAARADTVAMINLDSLTAGDLAYVYGSEGESGRIREWLLGEARAQGLELRTQTGTPQDPPGTTCDCSDHAPFDAVGIEYAYFESTNWDLGDGDGFTQVAAGLGEGGRIWHTPYDTLDYIEANFPGRVAERLDLVTRLLYRLLTAYEEP